MSSIKDKRIFITTALLCGAVVIIFCFWYLHRDFVLGLSDTARLAKNSSISQSISTSTDSAFGTEVTNGITYKTVPMQIGSKTFTAEIADTDSLRELGLGNRTSLEAGKAMLFVFDHPSRYAFWMKDMQFSIDMVWLDQEGRVITIASSVSPQTYPKSFGPSAPSSYVVELPANTMRDLKIKNGDLLIFDKSSFKNSSN